MNTESLILSIRKNILWILIIALVAFVVSYKISGRLNNYYKADIMFLLNDLNLTDDSPKENSISSVIKSKSLETERILAIIYSDALIQKVDVKLKLGKHYHLDDKDPKYMTKLTASFVKNVTVEITSSKIMLLKVRDAEGPEFVANLAESIMNELLAFNRDQTKELLNEKLAFNRALFNTLDSRYISKLKNLEQLVEQLRHNRPKEMTFNDFLIIKYNIMETTKQMGMLTSEIEDNIRSNLLINKTLEGKKLERIIVLNKKYLMPQSQNLMLNLSVATIVSILTILLLIVAIHSYGSNKDLIRLFIFGKKKE